MLATLVTVPAGAPAAAVQTVDAALAGYLSTHSLGSVSVIVQARGDARSLEDTVRARGGHVDSELPAIHAFIATVSPGLAGDLNHDARVERINLNAPIKFLGNVDSSHLLNRYEPMSRIPSAWAGGLDGSEVTVAQIDTGAWPHNDLVQKSPYVPGNAGNRLLTLATNPRATDALDHYGHGTHVAGIIGGNGYDSSGQYIGVAPNSLVVSVKVSDDLGNANEGDLITGMEWVYQANQHGMHIRVVNISAASTVAQSYHQSALDAMAEKLWKSGVTVVAAAGNGSGSVQYAPGNDPFVITVGSIDDNYQSNLSQAQMASWALYGTTQDGVQKPDVVADGSHVVSLLAPGSQLSVQHPSNIQAPSAPTYFKMGGTSMATPQVAGLVALMLQNSPQLTNGQVKSLLKRDSVPFGTTAYTRRLGTPGGFVDVSAIRDLGERTDDNAGVPTSQSFDPVNNNILAGGIWWTGANWSNAVSWNNIGWSNIGWSSVDFSNIGWSNVNTSNPTQTAAYWSNIGWSNIGWSNIGWSNIGWSNIGWSNIGWSNIGWSNIGWSADTFN